MTGSVRTAKGEKMGRLIDAFELMRSMEFHDDCANCDCDKLECEYDRIYTKQDICDFVESHIFNAPVVDAVEVVRCKDCKWCKPINNEVRGFYKNCFRHEIAVYDDGFCAWGERREDGEVD